MTGQFNQRSVGKFKIKKSKNILTEAIDRQESLLEAVQRVFALEGDPLPKSASRFILRLRNQDLPQSSIVQDNLMNAFKSLRYINPNWYPQTPDAWNDYVTCQQAFVEFQTVSSTHSLEDLFKETRGQWKQYADLIRKHGPLKDVKDWSQALYRNAVVPLIAKTHPEQVKKAYFSDDHEMIFSRRKFKDILEASCRWHDQVGGFHAQISTASLDKDNVLSWPALSESQEAPNSILIQPLTNKYELLEEGEYQGHCVGGYVSRCLYHDSHILSLRDNSLQQNRLTVELRASYEQENVSLRVAQHQGYGRRPPREHEMEALNWYIKQIDTGVIQPDWDHIIKCRDAALESKGTRDIVALLDFDPSDEQQCREVFYICRPYFVNKGERNMSYEQFVSSHDWSALQTLNLELISCDI